MFAKPIYYLYLFFSIIFIFLTVVATGATVYGSGLGSGIKVLLACLVSGSILLLTTSALKDGSACLDAHPE